MERLGKSLLVCGLLLAAVGAGIAWLGRSDGKLLPGDFVMERRNIRFYFPLATCLIISLALSVVAWFSRR